MESTEEGQCFMWMHLWEKFGCLSKDHATLQLQPRSCTILTRSPTHLPYNRQPIEFLVIWVFFEWPITRFGKNKKLQYYYSGQGLNRKTTRPWGPSGPWSWVPLQTSENKRPPLQVIVPLFDGRLKFEKTKFLHFAVTPKGTRPSNRPCLFDGIVHEKRFFMLKFQHFSIRQDCDYDDYHKYDYNDYDNTELVALFIAWNIDLQ